MSGVLLSIRATASDFQLLLNSGGDAIATLAIPLDNDRCYRMNITDDSDIEGTEQFTISFVVDFTQPDTSIANRITSDPAEATIFIQDNDGNKQ